MFKARATPVLTAKRFYSAAQGRPAHPGGRLKRESSQWIKSLAPGLASFYWQNGYGVFSISPGHVEPLKRYIANQEEHHRKVTFQDEFRRLLKLYGIAYDERYVWD